MQIQDHLPNLTLTKDQTRTVAALENFLAGPERAFILRGYAGSGKTTILKGVVNYLEAKNTGVRLMAPTGRAAKVLNDKTGANATTVHSAIYNYQDLKEVESKDKDTTASFKYFFGLRNDDTVHAAVLIVDEASMLSDQENEGEFFKFGSGRLLTDLVTFARLRDGTVTSKVIFVGDPAQLPPIGMNFSPALEPSYLEEQFGVTASQEEMKEVKRQADKHAIVAAAADIRRSITSGSFNNFDLDPRADQILQPTYANFLQTYKGCSGTKIIISYANATAQHLNSMVRKDKYGDDGPLRKADTIIIGANNHKLGVFNGEFGVVADVEQQAVTRRAPYTLKGGASGYVNLTWRKITLLIRGKDGKPESVSGYFSENFLYGESGLSAQEQIALYTDFKARHPDLKPKSEEFKEAIRDDLFFNCIKLKFGYAVTCHKAQGGEWDNAFVIWDRGADAGADFYTEEQGRKNRTNAQFYQWAYTAVTRAADRLYCLNPPHFNSFSSLTYTDLEVAKAFDALVTAHSTKVELAEAEVLPVLERFGLTDAPQQFKAHLAQRWHHLKSAGIDVVAWQKKSYEIWYVFKKGNETAGFKYWINGKNEFKDKHTKLPKQTSSDELYSEIEHLLKNAALVRIVTAAVPNTAESYQLETAITEESPFLKHLYDRIAEQLEEGETIEHIAHNSYVERYTLGDQNGKFTLDFQYDGKGFFTTAKPLPKHCTSPSLSTRVRAIISSIKNGKHDH